MCSSTRTLSVRYIVVNCAVFCTGGHPDIVATPLVKARILTRSSSVAFLGGYISLKRVLSPVP